MVNCISTQQGSIMSPGAQISAAIELLEKIWWTTLPAPKVVNTYFRGRRFAGSSDRRAIKTLFYEVIRKRSKLYWWFRKFEPKAHFVARKAVIVYLSLSNNYKTVDIFNHFSNKLYHPPLLTYEEKILIKYLEGKNLHHTSMPNFVAGEYPEWLEKTFNRLWGNKTLNEALALNSPAPLDLRVNTLKTNRKKILNELVKEGVDVCKTPFSPLGLRAHTGIEITRTRAHRTGKIEIQDEGSQIASLLCGAEPGMKVIDYCAGSGGKTLAIAATMQNKGQIIACDISAHRLEKMKRRLKRGHIKNVSIKVISTKEIYWYRKNKGQADRVLCDVPCSSSGIWRRHPEKKWHFTRGDLEKFCKTQKQILSRAQLLVKPGGRLVYITCSIIPEENHEQISWFLDNFNDFSITPAKVVWEKTFPKATFFSSNYLELSPARTKTDGFFCAILEKA